MNLVVINDLFKVEKGSLQSTKCNAGDYNFITAANDWKTHESYTHNTEALVFAAAASGSLGRTHYANGKFVASDLCYILTPKDSNKYPISLKFYHFVFTALKQDIVTNTKSGTSKEAINQKNFKSYQLPYFGIEQQTFWINKLLGTKDHIENITSEITNQQELLQKLRQQILQDAISGKLTAKWREDNPDVEPASVLLERIKAEKKRLVKEKKIKKQKPLPPITKDEIPFNLPKGWCWCRLGDVTELITSGSRDWAKYYSDTGAIFVRMGNLSKDSFNLRMDTIQRVQPPNSGEGKRTSLQAGDILISITGEVGSLGLIPDNFGEAYINQHTGMVRLMLKSNKYFAYAFLTPFLKRQFDEPQRGMKNSFRLTDIQNLLIPLPPESEIDYIVERMESCLNRVDTLETQSTKSQREAELLMQAVLKEAFEG